MLLGNRLNPNLGMSDLQYLYRPMTALTDSNAVMAVMTYKLQSTLVKLMNTTNCSHSG